MTGAPITAELDRIGTRLAQYRDQPPSTQDVSESDLSSLFGFLINSSQSTDGPLHWFCSRTDPLLLEAATFMIRLHAYNGNRVQVWKTQLERCLSGCADCVAGLQIARATSRHTYFGAFADNLLAGFYKSLSNQILEFFLAKCKEAQLSPDAPSQAGRTLADLPPSLVYLMLSEPDYIRHPKVMGLVRNNIPAKHIQGWPLEAPPAGLLVLLMEKTPEVRAWASSQVALCTTRPMNSDRFLDVYLDALQLCTSAIISADSPSLFSEEDLALWRGYSVILRFVPKVWLRPSRNRQLDVRQIVVGHLSDTGPHFAEVLKAFLIVLDRLGPSTWENESDEYPQVAFNTIKDNTSYSELLQVLPVDRGYWAIQWLEAYVKSIGNLPVFSSVMPLIIQYLCEGLQHERYKEARSAAISVASKLLQSVLFDAVALQDTQLPPLTSVWESLDIHANIFVSVAFGRAYSADSWSEAREAARKLIKASLKTDVTNIHKTIAALSVPPVETTVVPPLSVRTQIWKKTYESILPNDSFGIATVLETLSLISHVDNLLEGAFKSHKTEGQKVLRNVNNALDSIRSGFPDAVSRYLDFTNSGSLLELLSERDAAKNVMLLMFSPSENVRGPAQAIVGLAMDVESRPDCFKALILNFPGASMEGMTRFLETFIKFAPRVPEACSLSKALALCLTDIIDVFCSNPDGLLHKSNFLKAMGDPGPQVQLPKWWALMSKALSIIFKETPKWAPFFENSEMVTWMRDAVIFGRDMLAQRKVIEMGALALSPQSSSNRAISRIGSKMVDNLQDVLLELTRWLRLTDEELLFQSFSLLQSLLGCFKETKIDPSPTALDKLRRHVDNAQSKDSARQQTRLDASRLNGLRDSIRAFEKTESSDDEVQIVEHVIKPKPEPSKQAGYSKYSTSKAPVQQKLTSLMPKAKVPEKKKLPPAKMSLDFSANEQRTLSSASAMPKFKRKTMPSSAVAGPSERSKAVPAISLQPKPQAEPTSDSSESSSDEEGGTLQALAKVQAQKVPTVKKPVERRQVKMLDMPTNAKNPALERLKRSGIDEAQRTALRLKPDVSSLHHKILSWSYDHTGPQPPGEPLRLLRVPDSFQNPRHYFDVFEPLLLMECWAQIQQSKEESEETYDCSIIGRSYTDDWVDMDVSIVGSLTKDWYLSETDIVLLRHPTNPVSHLLKVTSYTTAAHGTQATLRMIVPLGDPGPQGGSTWRLRKVFSLTTLHREYGALMGFPYYDMRDTILNPSLQKVANPDPSELERTMKLYNLNEPQSTAILNALRTDGFSLIQGPPGTGKTSTICGLVQSFLSKRPKPLNTSVGRNPGPAEKDIARKILLCAPSNAAIDEITSRLKEGMSGPGQQLITPKVVRVGNPRSMNVSVKDVSLDFLTEQKLNENPTNQKSSKDTSNEMALLRSEIEAVKRTRLQKMGERDSIHDNTAKTLALEEEIRKLRQQTLTLGNQIDKLRDQRKSDSRAMDALARRCRAQVLQEADVICATLAGSGHEMLEPFDFEMVVIDEAAQAIELSSLIPLKYRCSRCVMVGDPQQLPPTVISQEASKFGYNQSLFVRLQKHRPDAVHLLSIQYRMHPEISVLPSRIFYNGRLLNGPDMAAKTQKPWHTAPKFGPYRFYNVAKGVEEKGRFHSLVNRSEAQVAVALFNRLRQEFPSYDFDFRIGIVTMYRAQVSELRRAFEQRFGSSITGVIDFNTVDGFQGQEKDIIILSCVRAGVGLTSVGFLADVRRMNVALTRAKSSVFVLGNAATLERSDETWKTIVHDARERSCLVDADVSFFTAPSNSGTFAMSAKNTKTASKAARPKATSSAAAHPPPADGYIILGRKPPSPVKAGPPSPVKSQGPQDQDMSVTLPAKPMNNGSAGASGHTRPAQTMSAPGGLPPRPPRPDGHPPRQKPPEKKPKPPRSIFLPSKRPPPDDGQAGPSTNRRRI